MRRTLRSAAICVLVILISAHSEAGPPSRGGGSFGPPAGGFGPTNRSLGGSSFGNLPLSRWDREYPQQPPIGYEYDDSTLDSRTQNGLSFEQRSRTQERILNQRLEQAEHSRQLSADNQNARLGEAAARMEQNAQQRFADQNQRLDSFQNPAQVPGAHQLGGPQTGYDDGGPSNRFGPEQLRAYEERMVQQRLNQAERFNQFSTYSGHTRESDTASRIQQNAQNRFYESFPTPSVDPYVPQHPGMGNPQIAPSLPPHLQSFRNPFLGENMQPFTQQNPGVQQPQVTQPTPPAMHSFQNTFPGQNVNQQMPQYPSVEGPQAAPSAPPTMAKKPSVFEKMRGLWPFK